MPMLWPRDVACILSENAACAVFIDPLVPADQAEFWGWADDRCRGREVVVLETIRFHRRSREAVLARYSAATMAAEAAVPAYWGVEPHSLPATDETVFWIPEHRALVPGDVLIGTGGGGLSLCPQSWLEELSEQPTLADLRAAMGGLRELDVEMVLVSHGDPALRDGRAELARALDSP
jgi:hypothetical protein